MRLLRHPQSVALLSARAARLEGLANAREGEERPVQRIRQRVHVLVDSVLEVVNHTRGDAEDADELSGNAYELHAHVVALHHAEEDRVRLALEEAEEAEDAQEAADALDLRINALRGGEVRRRVRGRGGVGRVKATALTALLPVIFARDLKQDHTTQKSA